MRTQHRSALLQTAFVRPPPAGRPHCGGAAGPRFLPWQGTQRGCQVLSLPLRHGDPPLPHLCHLLGRTPAATARAGQHRAAKGAGGERRRRPHFYTSQRQPARRPPAWRSFNSIFTGPQLHASRNKTKPYRRLTVSSRHCSAHGQPRTGTALTYGAL